MTDPFLNPNLSAQEIARNSGSNFLIAFRFLSQERREGIATVYAFARRVDDCVDEVDDPARQRELIEHYRREIARCYEYGHPEERFMRQLAQSIQRFSIPREPFEELLLGCEMDIERRSYQTIEELLQYCYRVASSVGLMCLPVFGCHHPDAKTFAVNLGLALQLTNILRDVASDADRGRVYLPAEDLRQYGYPPDGLEQRIYNESFLNLMRMESHRAKEFYEEAARSLPRQERKKLLPARIMGRIYRGILDEIVRREYRVFGPKIRLGKVRKAILIMGEMLGRGDRTG